MKLWLKCLRFYFLSAKASLLTFLSPFSSIFLFLLPLLRKKKKNECQTPWKIVIGKHFVQFRLSVDWKHETWKLCQGFALCREITAEISQSMNSLCFHNYNKKMFYKFSHSSTFFWPKITLCRVFVNECRLNSIPKKIL